MERSAPPGPLAGPVLQEVVRPVGDLTAVPLLSQPRRRSGSSGSIRAHCASVRYGWPAASYLVKVGNRTVEGAVP